MKPHSMSQKNKAIPHDYQQSNPVIHALVVKSYKVQEIKEQNKERKKRKENCSQNAGQQESAMWCSVSQVANCSKGKHRD